MLDNSPDTAATPPSAGDGPPDSIAVTSVDAPIRPRRRGRAAVREPGPPAPVPAPEPAPEPAAGDAEAAAPPAAKKPARRRRPTKAQLAAELAAAELAVAEPPVADPAGDQAGDRAGVDAGEAAPEEAEPVQPPAPEARDGSEDPSTGVSQPLTFVAPAFVAPEPAPGPDPDEPADDIPDADPSNSGEPDDVDAGEPGGVRRRRRGRRGRGRSRADEADGEGAAEGGEPTEAAGPASRTSDPADPTGPEGPGTSDAEETAAGIRRRRRRRRRAGGDGDEPAAEVATDPDEVPTVVHVRPPRQPAKRSRDNRDDDEVQGVKGSTRLEAKRQRRRDGRDSGRKRPTIISESEFLARREAVDRVMVVRESADRTQIGVLEDGVLVEHYVTKASASSYVGNVYLGRVQNVLPSMEAAFVDIGKGRNAVLYAGEVNYDASQFEGKPHRIEQALKSGDKVLVQVSKDPIGTKGSRLTSQISLPGRYVVFVPEGERTGISRKLPDTERARLKSILKRVAPEGAGLIVRTAAEGASEEELARDMARLVAQWEVIGKKAASATPPTLLHAEPDLVIRVIRDIFNEDFATMVVQGDREWETIEAYVTHVAPDLGERLERWTAQDDVFAAYRVDEQLAKALDRKVWLPSGGYLVFDRTEAMVVVDVNTGRFTGKGGNLEETVTRNNLEAAEELARQLRLRDLGGIIVVDFIDMVLESNRDLVLRRLMECLGRDRTKHQVAEVTSLGLVQMTRKRVGQGLQDVFAQVCPECNGRGIKTIIDPFEPAARSGGHQPALPKPAPPRHPPGPADPAMEALGAEPPAEPLDPPAEDTDDQVVPDLMDVDEALSGAGA